MTMEQFEKFIKMPRFKMALQLMSKEEFVRWAEKYYDDYQTTRHIIDNL